MNRTLIEELYTHNKISSDARRFAIELISPDNQWGLWISRILLTLGTALILAAIIFFFAFNWNQIGDFAKLGGIQVAIVACIFAAYILSLKKLSGKLLLLSASVLVGVFMAVFGQIYQTGADAYQLFMMWAIFTMGWTIISNFPAQWLFWFIVANLFLSTWWAQAAQPSRDMRHLIDLYLILLNGSALLIFEIGKSKKLEWLQNKWLRPLLTLVVMICLATPVMGKILNIIKSTSLDISAIVGTIGVILMFLIYRYKLPDIKSLSLVTLTGCVIITASLGRILFSGSGNIGAFFLMGILTLAIFGGAVTYLRKISGSLEA